MIWNPGICWKGGVNTCCTWTDTDWLFNCGLYYINKFQSNIYGTEIRITSCWFMSGVNSEQNSKSNLVYIGDVPPAFVFWSWHIQESRYRSCSHSCFIRCYTMWQNTYDDEQMMQQINFRVGPQQRSDRNPWWPSNVFWKESKKCLTLKRKDLGNLKVRK